jgi:hypothetical protein
VQLNLPSSILAARAVSYLVQTPVAVEKLFLTKFAKIKLRQEAPQSIYSGRLAPTVDSAPAITTFHPFSPYHSPYQFSLFLMIKLNGGARKTTAGNRCAKGNQTEQQASTSGPPPLVPADRIRVRSSHCDV